MQRMAWTGLQRLWCTDKKNGRSPVPGRNYPFIRYLRHDTDFPGDTPQSHLEAARDAARQLDKELNRFWRGLGKYGVIP